MTGFSTEAVKNLSIAIILVAILLMANDTLGKLAATWARL